MASRTSCPGLWLHLLTFSCQVWQGQGWWDEGHLATAAVAKLNLRQPQSYDEALSCADPEGVNFTDLVTSSAWADYAKCEPRDDHQAYCQSLKEKHSTKVFFPFHLAKSRPVYDPFDLGTDLPLEAQLINPRDPNFPSGITMMEDVSNSLRAGGQTPWSLALQLRLVLHAWGDMHQPLHTGDLYDPLNFPTGDAGGNFIRINGSAIPQGTTNLHALWDAVGGDMPGSMPLHQMDAKAQELASEYPADFFIQQGKLSESWDKPDQRFGVPTDVAQFVVDMVADTHSHIQLVYSEYLSTEYSRAKYPSRTYEPSAEYVNHVRTLSKQQVALGGYRLASWLNFHAQYLPSNPCGLRPRVDYLHQLLIGVIAGTVLAGAVYAWRTPRA